MKDISLSYYGKVKGGRISLPARLRKEVIGRFEGQRIEVIFKRDRKRRSNKQNAYYWTIIIPYVLQGFIDLGHDELLIGQEDSKEAIHGLLKERFLHNGITIEDAKGNVYDLKPSTKRCTTVEFMEYVERISKWAIECLNVVIPEPEVS